MGLFDTETKTTTTIPGRSSQEEQIMQLLSRLAQQSGGQPGDLSKLAQGILGGPTTADKQLVAQSIGFAGEQARNQLSTLLPYLAAQQREALGGQMGSEETVQAILGGLGQQQQLTSSLLAQQQQGGQALMQLPFQRAQTQLSANQQLFNQIAGTANPLLQYGLQERVAQPTTTQKQSQGWGQSLMQLGKVITSANLMNLGGDQAGGGAALL